jgi:hypothetical protein
VECRFGVMQIVCRRRKWKEMKLSLQSCRCLKMLVEACLSIFTLRLLHERGVILYVLRWSASSGRIIEDWQPVGRQRGRGKGGDVFEVTRVCAAASCCWPGKTAGSIQRLTKKVCSYLHQNYMKDGKSARGSRSGGQRAWDWQPRRSCLLDSAYRSRKDV